MHQTLANGDGGGNIPTVPIISIRRIAAIGDCVAASVVADKLHERKIPVIFQAHPMIHPILRRCPSIASVTVPDGRVDVNLDGIYEKDAERKTKHFHSYFIGGANAQLRNHGIDLGPPLNCRPTLIVTPNERELAERTLAKYPRPWVFIVPKSQWFKGREVPEYIWQAAAKDIKGTCFWLGMDRCAADAIVDLQCFNIDQVAVFLSAGDLLISTDTGPAHIAIALGIQTLLIGQSSDPILHFSDLCDFEVIYAPVECVNCQETRCPINQFIPPCQTIDPELIAAAANRKLRRDIVSCVIPTFNAPVERLTRCIEAVLPQVDEIIVTADAGGKFPVGAPKHQKIRYVKSTRGNLGFGRNVNAGVRHTSGNRIWVINDDFFSQPDVAEKLKSMMLPKVGMATHLIRYESTGKIYYGSKPRGPNGFYHLDHNQYLPSVTGTFEVENICGCSFMLDRKAFYEAKCFDEEFQKYYTEDDAIAMQLRSKGWRLMYTSNVFGNHIGSATTITLPDKDRIMHESNVLFGNKWANRYLEHNRNVKGLGNFSYLSS